MNKQAYTVAEFEAAYHVGHTKTCEEIANGNLVSYKLGRRRYISVRSAEMWQANLEAKTAATEAETDTVALMRSTKGNGPDTGNDQPAKKQTTNDAVFIKNADDLAKIGGHHG